MARRGGPGREPPPRKEHTLAKKILSTEEIIIIPNINIEVLSILRFGVCVLFIDVKPDAFLLYKNEQNSRFAHKLAKSNILRKPSWSGKTTCINMFHLRS